MKIRLIIFFGVIAGLVIFSLPSKTPIRIDNRPLAAWVNDLTVEDYQVRTAARSALLRLGEAAVPELRKRLRVQALPLQEDLEKASRRFGVQKIHWPRPALVRQRVLPVLADLGPKSAAAVPDVVENLIFPDSTVPLEAERVLRCAGPAAAAGLAQGLRNSNPALRAACARVLRDCAGADEKICAFLATLARGDRSPQVRSEAIRTLGAIQPNNSQFPTLLQEALRDPSPEVRIAAAQAAEETRIDSNSTHTALEACLADSSPQVRFHAAHALWRLDRSEKSILPVIVKCLRNRNAGWQAAYLLGEMKTQDPSAIAALIAAMQREIVDRPLRSAPSTSFALGQIGKAAVGELIPVLTNNLPRVRTGAVLALGFMGMQAHDAVPALVPLLRDRNGDVRQATALAIARIEPGGKRAMPVLIDMLHAEDIYVRMDAAEALRKIDPSKDWQIASE